MGEALLRTLFATLPWVECVLCLVPPYTTPYTPVKEMFDEMGRATETVDTREDVNVRNSVISRVCVLLCVSVIYGMSPDCSSLIA